jgi:L-ribulose-5-phosphate 3-epimerase
MQMPNRREFLAVAVGASLSLALPGVDAFAANPEIKSSKVKLPEVKFKIGVTDWNLKQESKLEAVALAKSLGFDGVQVSIGKGTDSLPLADPGLQKAYLEESKRMDVPVESLCLNILHTNFLKSDPLGARWVADSVGIAKAMNVRVVLLPFFNKGALTNRHEMERVGDILKEIAPSAEKAGVILGLEDTISARDNVRIMERTKSSAVLTYYDVGNSTGNGFNVAEEIRWLGRDRICEVHLKDNPHYLGEGSIDFKVVIDTLADIGFDRWAQLETVSPTSVDLDMRRNLAYIRGLIATRNAT